VFTRGCLLTSLDLTDARIDGDLIVGDATSIGSDGKADTASEVNVKEPPRGPVLDLNSARVSGTLNIRGLLVNGSTSLMAATIEGGLSCSGAKLRSRRGYSLVADHSDIGLSVVLDGGFEAEGGISFHGSKIGGQLVCGHGAKIARLDNTEAELPALLADHARIGQDLVCEGLVAIGEVRLPAAKIGGQFNLRGATLTNNHGAALEAFGAEVGLGILMNGGFTAIGLVSLARVTARGARDCSSASLHNDRGPAFDADGSEFSQSMEFTNSELHGGMTLFGAKVGRDLVCSRTTIERMNQAIVAVGKKEAQRPALNLNSIQVRGEVQLTEARVNGEVDLLGAEIGELNCSGAHIQNTDDDGYALSASLIRTEFGVRLVGMETVGEVNLDFARIGGQLLCSKAILRNGKGSALSADHAEIHEVVLTGLETVGVLRFLDATITGDFVCTLAKLDGRLSPNGSRVAGALNFSGAFIHDEGDERAERIALAASNAKFEQDVYLTNRFGADSDPPFTVDGGVKLTGTLIQGSLRCQGATLNNPDGTAFDGVDMIVRNGFYWSPETSSGGVSLTRAHVGQLDDDITTWPGWSREPKKRTTSTLDITGFTYNQFGLEASKVAVEDRLRWIELQTSRPGFYSPQPYLQLAQVYKLSGRDKDRRLVLIQKERDVGRYGGLRWIQRFLILCFGFLFGYGYRPLRGLALILATYAVAALFVWQASLHFGFQAVQESAILRSSVASSPRLATTCTNAYPCFSPWLYTAEAVIPVLNSRESNYWQFDASNPWGFYGRITLDSAAVAIWIFTTIFIIGLTRMFRET
jgi:hypothetical protein